VYKKLPGLRAGRWVHESRDRPVLESASQEAGFGSDACPEDSGIPAGQQIQGARGELNLQQDLRTRPFGAGSGEAVWQAV